MEDRSLIISNIVYRIAHDNDERAFRQFFDIFYGRMLQLAHLILRNNELAEYTVLEVFAKLWEKRTSLPQIESINKYLYVLVKNKALDQLRRDKDLIHIELTETTLHEQVVGRNPEKVFLEKELLDKMNVAVLGLPKKCRMVYRMVKEEGHSYQDVADLLHVSRKTVDNHLNLAMRRIRESIADYMKEQDGFQGQPWKVIRSFLMIFMV